MAAVEPTCATRPSISSSTPRLSSPSGTGDHGPTTNAAAEVLSAITSGSEKVKFAYRESISSIAGATARTARVNEPTGSPGSGSRSSRNATSGSTRGWMKSPTSTPPPSGTRITSVSRPQITSSTPTCAILALLVSPIFRPTSRSPRSRRRCTSAVCTAYAASTSRPVSAASCGIAVASSAAAPSFSAMPAMSGPIMSYSP